MLADALFITAIILAIAWAGRKVWRGIVGDREPEPMEPEAYGDTSCWPRDVLEPHRPAPEIGSGERAGGE